MLFFQNNKRIAILLRLLILFDRRWYQGQRVATIPKIAKEISRMITEDKDESVHVQSVERFLYSLRDAGILIPTEKREDLPYCNGEVGEYTLDKKKAVELSKAEFEEMPQFQLIDKYFYNIYD